MGEFFMLSATFRNSLMYIGAFILTVALALGLLTLAAFLPQEPVDENVTLSASEILAEPRQSAGHSFGETMSVTSESLMFMESKAMNHYDLSTVLSNPRFLYDESDSFRDYLYLYANGHAPDRVESYSRYWMGFRVTLRLLLQKLDFWQIRRNTAYLFFILIAAVLCSIAKNTNTGLAFSFALSLVFVNPHFVSTSLQAFTCFCIAFVAMLAVPWIDRNPKWEHLFFMEIGMATMFFDFYSTPVLTFGLPMIYLYLLRWYQEKQTSIKTLFKNILAWCSGYGFMWLSKLILTSIFTSENAFDKAFYAFSSWVTPQSSSGSTTEGYGPISSLYYVLLSLVSDKDGAFIFLLVVLALLIVFFIRFRKAKLTPTHLLKHYMLVLIALLPVLWFIIAARPTVVHHHFQYRSILVSLWACVIYLYISSERTPGSISR